MTVMSREVAMSELLELCAGELATMARDCARLQDDLSPALLSGAVEALDAQALDVLTQSLGAVSDYLCGLADQASPAWRLDPAAAAAGLPLAGLAARLTGQAVAASAHDEPFELFD